MKFENNIINLNMYIQIVNTNHHYNVHLNLIKQYRPKLRIVHFNQIM